MTRIQANFLFFAESRPSMFWAGLLTRRARQRTQCREPLRLPRLFSRVAREAAPSLTVAGPCRICTGFPVRPVMGAQSRKPITMCYKPPRDRVFLFVSRGFCFSSVSCLSSSRNRPPQHSLTGTVRDTTGVLTGATVVLSSGNSRLATVKTEEPGSTDSMTCRQAATSCPS